jgi:hypothetical protein
MPCVVRPDPEPDESLSGFVLRLAEANGYDRPSDLFGVPHGTTSNLNGRYMSKSTAEAVAGLAGLEPDSLVSKAYTGCSERAGRATFYGVELSSSQISAARPKLCPDCLLSRPILQAAWDLALWVVCPYHGCYLINRCQFCGSPIEWERSGVALCHHCGSPLTSVSGETAEEVAVELSLQMATLVPVLPREMRRSKFAEQLRDLSIRSLVDLVKFLGSPPRAKRSSRRKVTPTQARSVFKNAAEVLDAWPEGYHRFVEQWELFDPAAFRLALAQELSDPALLFLREEYRSYIHHNRERRALAISLERITPELREQQYVSVSRASEETGIGYWTILRMLPSAEVRSRNGNKQAIRFVRRSDLSELASSHDVAKWCSPGQALSRYLGPLRPRRQKALVEAGYITTKKLGSRQYFEIASLETLIARLEARARSSDGRFDDPVSLGNFPTSSKVCGICAIRLALEASLQVIEEWPRSIGLFRFAVSARALKAAMESTTSAHFTLAGAARFLSTDVAVVTGLLQHGLLEHEKVAGGGLRISEQALSSFCCNYSITAMPAQAPDGNGRSRILSDSCRDVIMQVTSKNTTYMVARANAYPGVPGTY